MRLRDEGLLGARRPAGAARAGHAGRGPDGRPAAQPHRRPDGREPRAVVGAHPGRDARRPRPRRRSTCRSAPAAASTTPTWATACSASCSRDPRTAVGRRRARRGPPAARHDPHDPPPVRPGGDGLGRAPLGRRAHRARAPPRDDGPGRTALGALADLARFAAFLLGDNGDVLDAGTLEEMTVPAGSTATATGAGTAWACRCCARAAGRSSATAARCRASSPACSSTGRRRRRGDPAQRDQRRRRRADDRPARRAGGVRAAGGRAPGGRSPRRSTSRCWAPGTGARRRTSCACSPTGCCTSPGWAGRGAPAGSARTATAPGRAWTATTPASR